MVFMVETASASHWEKTKTHLQLVLVKNLDQIQWNQLKESLWAKSAMFKVVLSCDLGDQGLDQVKVPL